MRIRVVSFGKIADILGSKSIEVEAANTSELQEVLFAKYPQLKNSVFAIAVNREVISGYADFQENSEIALLPPFSGG